MEMQKSEVDFIALLGRRHTERLAALVKGQTQSFWDTITAKLDASLDGTIAMDDVMTTLWGRRSR